MKSLPIKIGSSLISILLIMVLLFQSCLKDNFDFDKLAKTDWEPSFAVPLVNSTLDVYDLMAHQDSSDLLVIDSLLGLLALVYEGDTFSIKASDIITLPDQSTSQSFNMSMPEIATFVGSGTITQQLDYTYTFTTTAGVKIDSMTLESGSLDIDITSDFQHSGSLQIKIPSLSKNSIVFDNTLPINYSGSPVNITQSYDLSEYTFDMTNGGTTSNEIAIECTFTLNYSGSNPPTTSNSLTIDQAFNNMAFSIVYGDFGQQIFSLDKDSINVRIFNDAAAGVFYLIDPKLRINITNSFGFPMDVEFTTLESVNIPTGLITPITFNGFDNPFSVAYPTINNIGSAETTNLELNNSNSNIITLMAPTPKYLLHAIQTTVNPTGAPTTPNFITNQSELKINTELELALNGFAYNWMMTDTIDFSLEAQDSTDEVQSIILRAILTNGFPINARMQLLLTDSNYVVIDSLFNNRYENLIVSGKVNASGTVVEPTAKITDIPFDQSRVNNLYKAKHIIIWGMAETINYLSAVNVKIFKQYTLNVKLGIKANMKIKI